MDSKTGEKHQRLILVSVMAAAAFLRFYRLGHQSFWVDEIMSYWAFTPPPGVSIWKKLLVDVHGPLHSLVLYFWSRISGSDAWLRAPSAVAGLLSVYLVYRWLRALGKSRLAVFGALFMALSPFNIYYSQELRFYSFLCLFSLVTLIVFERFIADPTIPKGILLGVSLALACLSHFSAFFLGISLIAYLAISRRLKGKHLRFGALAALVVLVIYSPWIYSQIAYVRSVKVAYLSSVPVDERLRGGLTLSAWSYPYALYAFSVGFSLGPDLRELHYVSSPLVLLSSHGFELVVTGLLFGFLFLSAVYGAVRCRSPGLPVIIVAVTLACTTIVTLVNIKVFNVRYLTSAFPAYIALLVLGLPGAGMRRNLLVAAVGAVLLLSDWNYHHVPRYARDDARAAAGVVNGHELRGDLIVIPTISEVFERYYEGPNKIMVFFPDVIGREEVVERIDAYLELHGRIWYLKCRNWIVDRDDMMIEILSSRAGLEESWRFPGVVLQLYRKNGLRSDAKRFLERLTYDKSVI